MKIPIKENLLRVLLIATFIIGVKLPAGADTIIKFDLNEVRPDVAFVDGVFGTTDGGDAATIGNQNTAIVYTGFLDSILADILTGASMSISNVLAVGNAVQIAEAIVQQTNGGTFGIWDSAGELLLQADIGNGVFSGTTVQSTGSFFNTSDVNYTGGSLLSYVLPTGGGISLALASIATGDLVGLRIIDGTLQNFSANGAGLITGQASEIPEPTTMLLLGSGMLCLLGRRRLGRES